MYGNLHLHSTHSDGVDTPADLVKLGKKLGFSALALTDHDTTSGWTEFAEACQREGMKYLLGTEFYAALGDVTFHMVGLGFRREEPAIRALLQEGSARAAKKFWGQFERAQKAGLFSDVTREELEEALRGIGFPSNDHLFRLLVKKGSLTLREYPAFLATFSQFRGEKTKQEYPSPLRVIRAVKEAGGVSILAHPGQGDQFSYLLQMAEWGLDGVETRHADHSPEDVEKAEEYARRLGLLVSGGTDHSGVMGGQYAFYEAPEKTEYFRDDKSFGVTREELERIEERILK